MTTSLHSRASTLLAPLALLASLMVAPAAQAQSDTFFVKGDFGKAVTAVHPMCHGKVRQVQDVTFEGVQTTPWNFAAGGGGGEGGHFDPVPVLSTKVNLTQGCLNAHFSALVGSKLYGVSNMTLFQVALTPSGGGLPIHMAGHYETPYGIPSPAVALSAEYDVDMLGANFYQGIGQGTGLIPPGPYRVDVYWAGGPTAAGGAIGAAFTLKLYQY